MIEGFKNRITLTSIDAIELVETYKHVWRNNSFIYFDPPYFNQGKHLYHNYYCEEDHQHIVRKIEKLKKHHWIVSAPFPTLKYQSMMHLAETASRREITCAICATAPCIHACRSLSGSVNKSEFSTSRGVRFCKTG